MKLPPAMLALRPGLASSLALAPLLYHLVRALEHLRAPEPDPAGVLWAARSSLLDRVGVTAYLLVALAVFLAPWLARRAVPVERVCALCVGLGALAGILGPLVAR